MEKNILNNRLSVKFIAEKENRLTPFVTMLVIISCCILVVVRIYFLIINPSLKTVLWAILSFLSLPFLLEVNHECLDRECIKLEINEDNFIVSRGNQLNKFDIKKCKIEFHIDKTDWISLSCEDHSFTLSLLRYSKKDLLNFIENFKTKIGDASTKIENRKIGDASRK